MFCSDCRKNVIDWFCLINSKGVGPKTFWDYLRRYGSAESSIKYLKNAFPRQEAIKILDKFDGHVILASDSNFPTELRRDPACPPMLFVKGDISILNNRKIAIIGARNASISGKAIAETLGFELSRYYVIVSGLANGIDTSTHKGALKNIDGKLLAVMPFSLDNVYPKENKKLFDQVVERGLAITEVPPCRTPDQGMFHARNRIIAVLSLGVITVEAALKSGTISTAKLALELGAEVMAVPGSPADPRSRGCNDLIKKGAPLVEDYKDVLDVMNLPTLKLEDSVQLQYTSSKMNDIGAKILDMLSVNCATSVDLIADNLHTDVGTILSNISELEVLGKVVKCSTNEVILNVEGC